MAVATPCQVCGRCEYGEGCEDIPVADREPLCFYRLHDLEDRLIELPVLLTDDQVDAVIGVVRQWLSIASRKARNA